jgi:DivIVA domain-containing protein
VVLTPDDVLQVRFAATHLRHGYDRVEVDDLLDRVVATLRHGPAQGDLTVAELDATALRTRHLAGGYDAGQVDAFLARVRATLLVREATPGDPAPAPRTERE